MGQASRTQELLGRLAGRRHQALQLGPGRVLLVVPSEAATQPQGQLLAHFVVNLIARLFPIVRARDVVIFEDREIGVFVPRWREATLRKSIEQMLVELAPPASTRVIGNVPVPNGYDCIVTVGQPVSFPTNVIVGSTGWIAQVSTTESLAVGGPPNPVGAYAAACFGACRFGIVCSPHTVGSCRRCRCYHWKARSPFRVLTTAMTLLVPIPCCPSRFTSAGSRSSA